MIGRTWRRASVANLSCVARVAVEKCPCAAVYAVLDAVLAFVVGIVLPGNADVAANARRLNIAWRQDRRNAVLCIGVPQGATGLAAILQVLPVLGEDVVGVVASAARSPAPVGIQHGAVAESDVVVVASVDWVPQIP